MIPAFGRGSSMRRFHSARRRPGGSWTRCGRRPRTGDGAKTKALLYCLHLRSLRNDAVLGVTPKGDEKLAGQCHDHDLLDSATGFADPFAEPSRQGAVRLPAEPQPGEFHHRRSPASVTVLADPL